MTLVNQVVAWLAQQSLDVYLVGGCVRDLYLGRPVHDLDLAVAGSGLELARRLADLFGGAFYPLDVARSTGRAILHIRPQETLIVDVARLRGDDLRADLAARDFTANALAIHVRDPGKLIDYHNGLADLNQRRVRIVSEHSIRDDPVRALRALRQAAELKLTLAPETEAAILRDGVGLRQVSGERIRDELCRLLAMPDSAPTIVQLEQLGLLTLVLPELEPMRGLAQPLPHYLSGLAHTLETLRQLEWLLGAMRSDPDLDPDAADGQGKNLPTENEPGTATAVSECPGPAAQVSAQVLQHLDLPIGPLWPRVVTVKLAALLHDTGKPSARALDEEGRMRFLGHHDLGATITRAAFRRLRFSNTEALLAETIVRHHMRPLLLAAQECVTARAVYRFFRDTGDAGPDVLLHALADHRATWGPETTGTRWQNLLNLAVRMWTDYFWRHTERVEPPLILNGRDLLGEFSLNPGPRIGELLEEIREAQVTGQVSTREQALEFVRGRLAERT